MPQQIAAKSIHPSRSRRPRGRKLTSSIRGRKTGRSGGVAYAVQAAAESDGIISSGSLGARTFGEAQIDLRLIFQANKCTSFGSAMLKSRSSDAFNS
jgi:hypothetical protein